MDPDTESYAVTWPGTLPFGVPGPAPTLPLVEELPRSLTPLAAFGQLRGWQHRLFLDSALGHAALGRYSFVTADPFRWLAARGADTQVNGVPLPREAGDPFRVLAESLKEFRAEEVPGLPPFQGGAAGLMGYDLCHHLEDLPRHRVDEFGVPDLGIGFYDWVIAFDHAQDRSWLISTGFPEKEGLRRRRRAEDRLRRAKARLGGRLDAPAADDINLPHAVTPRYRVEVPGRAGVFSNFTRDGYLAAARRAVEYVHAGDCFQVNLAQRLLHAHQGTTEALYQRLRERNAAPFAAYVDLGDYVVASASPERFLRVDRGEVEARPIKGTRPRGTSEEQERLRVEELKASPKDRAENIMIVDLLRNDLGRVCRYGSVRVPALCQVETYRYVHHLVSEVRGRLRPESSPVDLLRAAFPGGSVTGAPKIRAMEIIAELEPTARGPYCGSVGYLGFDGSMDTSILIRTFVIGGGWVQCCVGGGIVADSVPEQEYTETWHKAEGMLRALQ